MSYSALYSATRALCVATTFFCSFTASFIAVAFSIVVAVLPVKSSNAELIGSVIKSYIVSYADLPRPSLPKNVSPASSGLPCLATSNAATVASVITFICASVKFSFAEASTLSTNSCMYSTTGAYLSTIL